MGNKQSIKGEQHIISLPNMNPVEDTVFKDVKKQKTSNKSSSFFDGGNSLILPEDIEHRKFIKRAVSEQMKRKLVIKATESYNIHLEWRTNEGEPYNGHNLSPAEFFISMKNSKVLSIPRRLKSNSVRLSLERTGTYYLTVKYNGKPLKNSPLKLVVKPSLDINRVSIDNKFRVSQNWTTINKYIKEENIQTSLTYIEKLEIMLPHLILVSGTYTIPLKCYDIYNNLIPDEYGKKSKIFKRVLKGLKVKLWTSNKESSTCHPSDMLRLLFIARPGYHLIEVFYNEEKIFSQQCIVYDKKNYIDIFRHVENAKDSAQKVFRIEAKNEKDVKISILLQKYILELKKQITPLRTNTIKHPLYGTSVNLQIKEGTLFLILSTNVSEINYSTPLKTPKTLKLNDFINYGKFMVMYNKFLHLNLQNDNRRLSHISSENYKELREKATSPIAYHLIPANVLESFLYSTTFSICDHLKVSTLKLEETFQSKFGSPSYSYPLNYIELQNIKNPLLELLDSMQQSYFKHRRIVTNHYRNDTSLLKTVNSFFASKLQETKKNNLNLLDLLFTVIDHLVCTLAHDDNYIIFELIEKAFPMCIAILGKDFEKLHHLHLSRRIVCEKSDRDFERDIYDVLSRLHFSEGYFKKLSQCFLSLEFQKYDNLKWENRHALNFNVEHVDYYNETLWDVDMRAWDIQLPIPFNAINNQLQKYYPGMKIDIENTEVVLTFKTATLTLNIIMAAILLIFDDNEANDIGFIQGKILNEHNQMNSQLLMIEKVLHIFKMNRILKVDKGYYIIDSLKDMDLFNIYKTSSYQPPPFEQIQNQTTTNTHSSMSPMVFDHNDEFDCSAPPPPL